jgi:hypothetical protein
MSVLAEKLLAGAARLTAWAPNMDVIAMVSADGCGGSSACDFARSQRSACSHFLWRCSVHARRQLCVYRLNWQRLWVHSSEEDVRVRACPVRCGRCMSAPRARSGHCRVLAPRRQADRGRLVRRELYDALRTARSA